MRVVSLAGGFEIFEGALYVEHAADAVEQHDIVEGLGENGVFNVRFKVFAIPGIGQCGKFFRFADHAGAEIDPHAAGGFQRGEQAPRAS